MELLRRLKRRSVPFRTSKIGTGSKATKSEHVTPNEDGLPPVDTAVEPGLSKPLTKFPPLPHELIVLILRFALVGSSSSDYLVYLSDGEQERPPLTSKREQLKHLRYEGRAFRDAVTPAIFATVHLHASDLSFDRAERIGTSQYANLVREVVIHDGSFADLLRTEQFFLRTLASHRRRQDYPRKLIDAIESDTSALYSNYVEELEAVQAVPFQRHGKYEFDEMFAKFPNLSTIVCTQYSDEWHDPEQSAYTMRRTGLSYLPMATEYSFAMFTAGREHYKWSKYALHTLQPKALNLTLWPRDAAEFGLFQGIEDGPCDLRQRCARLRYLIIGPKASQRTRFDYDHPPPSEWGAEWYGRMFELLTASSSSLVHLELTGAFSAAERFFTVPKGHLPRLKHLTFSGEDPYRKWPVEGLLKWIEAVSDSLEWLSVWNVELLHREEGTEGGYDSNVDLSDYDQDLRHSLVPLCCRITTLAKLKRLEGLETVEDNKGPASGSALERKRMLCRKIEDAVCHRREWPLGLLQHAEQNTWNTLLGPSELERRQLSFILKPWQLTADEFENQGQIYENESP